MIGKDVQGTVTAEIKDQPWDVALQAILQAQGLAASEENTGIISVDSYANILAKEANEPLTTQLVAINYANAASLVQTIASLLSKDCSKAGLTTAASGAANNQQTFRAPRPASSAAASSPTRRPTRSSSPRSRRGCRT